LNPSTLPITSLRADLARVLRSNSLRSSPRISPAK
jgi:hypothetical protein